MKRAELGLLEVLGLVVNAGRGGMCRGELRILLSFIFGANKPLCFLFSRRRTLCLCFLRVDSSFLRADI